MRRPASAYRARASNKIVTIPMVAVGIHASTSGFSRPPGAGTISIARGNWHLEVLPTARIGSPPTLHLTQGPVENHCRPAVDVLFRSVAAVYGAGVLAVVLTGMGADGTLGAADIVAAGGSIIAQDEATSVVWGMPRSVAQAGLCAAVLPLDQIAPKVIRLFSGDRV